MCRTLRPFPVSLHVVILQARQSFGGRNARRLRPPASWKTRRGRADRGALLALARRRRVPTSFSGPFSRRRGIRRWRRRRRFPSAPAGASVSDCRINREPRYSSALVRQSALVLTRLHKNPISGRQKILVRLSESPGLSLSIAKFKVENAIQNAT